METKTPNIVDFRKTPNSNNVILFVHGFSGEAETTFGNTARYLSQEAKMNGWDMFSVGYSSNAMPSIGTGIWAAIPDITKLSQFLITTIRSEFKKYDRIGIVAHSMGGLVVQKAIVELEPLYKDKIQYLLLFGTPSNGLVKAGLVKFWNKQLRDMSSGGVFITELRAQWNKMFANGYPFLFKTVAGTDDEFVPVLSSQQPFDKKYWEVVSGNHLTIVKPENINHAGYQLILASFTKVAFIDVFSDKEAVNLLLGNYTAVVNQLLPLKDKLDKNGLVKLILSLEGLGRSAEAVAILETNPTARGNSDLLAILAGRYKRKYLLNYEAADAEVAITYYKEALEMALTKTNKEDTYYPAINLAFLHLVYKEDRKAMAEYAQQALAAANASPDNSWKFATIGEANICLENFAVAKDNYQKAAALAGVREKLSMYANAYMSYTTLKHIESRDDEFVKFLKATLLA